MPSECWLRASASDMLENAKSTASPGQTPRVHESTLFRAVSSTFAAFASMDAPRARRFGPAFLILAVSGGALLSFVAPGSGARSELRRAERSTGVTARSAFSWDADEPPQMPNTPEEMLQQAAAFLEQGPKT